MTTIPRALRFASAVLAVGALSAFAAPASLGALTASPNPSATGNFTVFGSVPTTRSYEWFSLIETGPAGTVQSFGVTDPAAIDLSFSGKSAGAWTYRVEGCYLETVPGLQEVIEECEFLGNSLSAVVRPPSATGSPVFGDTAIPSVYWYRDAAIMAFVFEAATGGDGTLSYTASGLPAGVTMSASRRISGTPTAVGSGIATVTATDSDGDTATKSFSWTVSEDVAPSFGGATVAPQSWEAGSDIGTLAAPLAIGGNAPLDHGARGLPGGVSLVRDPDAGTYSFMGTPEAAGSGTATLVVGDRDGDTDTLTFTWTVKADTGPSFGSSTVAAKTWTLGNAIGAFTLPSATGGNGTISYGARGLPDGVTVSPSLQVTGRPLATGSGTATLTARDADGDTATLAFAWSVTSADAPKGKLLSVNPDPTVTNDYTIVSTYSATRTYTALTLTETGPTGHTKTYSPTGRRFSQPIVNRANGTYTYVLTECYPKQVPGLQEVQEVCESVGDLLTVTVDGPTPDSVAAQLEDAWETRVGDLDGDSLVDVYLKRTSEAVGGGLLRDVILRQEDGGVFSAEPAPSGSANATSASTWPVSTVAEAVLNDINLDGFVDVLVRGLGTAIGATIPDQMVYASGRRPQVVLNAVDDGVKNFLGEVSEWIQNPEYFENKVETRTEARVRLQTRCLSESGAQYGVNLDDVCWLEPVVSVWTVSIPTNLSAEARQLSGQFDVNDGLIDPGLAPGSVRAKNVAGIFEEVYGVEMLNGVLTENCPSEGFLGGLPCTDEGLVGLIVMRAVEYALVDVNSDPPNADGSVDRNGEPTIQPGEYRLLTDFEKQVLRENGFADLTNPDAPDDSIIFDDIKVFHHAKTGDDDPVEYKVDRIFVLRGVFPNTIGMPECNATERRDYPTCYTDEFTGVSEVHLLVHEATHIWQNRIGMRTDIVVDENKYSDTYQYRLHEDENGNEFETRPIENKDFSCFTREQQAEMVADLYQLRQGRNPRLTGNHSDGNMNKKDREDAIEALEAVVPVPLPKVFTTPSVGNDPCQSGN